VKAVSAWLLKLAALAVLLSALPRIGNLLYVTFLKLLQQVPYVLLGRHDSDTVYIDVIIATTAICISSLCWSASTLRTDTHFLSERVVRAKLLRGLIACLTIYSSVVTYSYFSPGMNSTATFTLAAFLHHIGHFADDAYAVTMNRAFGAEIGLALILSIIISTDALLAYVRCRAGAFGLNGLEAKEMAAYVLRTRATGSSPDRWSPEPVDAMAPQLGPLGRLARLFGA
jgi:hypothetical protein